MICSRDGCFVTDARITVHSVDSPTPALRRLG